MQRGAIADNNSATASRTRTLSNVGSDHGGYLGQSNPTIMDDRTLLLKPPAASTIGLESFDIDSVLQHMESMQGSQLSKQQPNEALDNYIRDIIGQRPEIRQRLAIKAKSAWLRRKILTVQPYGGRGVGSAQLGASHPWRRTADNTSDHNWPKLSHCKMTGTHILEGGGEEHHRVLRAPADKLRINPLLEHSACYSIPRKERFPGTHANGEVKKGCARTTPGPGAYFKSAPRGTAFSTDGGETVVLGANHMCPWKGAMGHHINPVHCDQTVLHAPPKWSFSKTRRSVSEPSIGHLCAQGAVKSDFGMLSPGIVYEHHGSMRPSQRRALARGAGATDLLKKKTRVVVNFVDHEEGGSMVGGDGF